MEFELLYFKAYIAEACVGGATAFANLKIKYLENFSTLSVFKN